MLKRRHSTLTARIRIPILKAGAEGTLRVFRTARSDFSVSLRRGKSMISIWFFVALVVAFVAIHLLRHRDAVHAAHPTESGHMGHASRGKRGTGCCH